MQMPKIDLDAIKAQVTPEEFSLIKGIVASKGKNKGCLRASKPKVAAMVKVAAASPRWNGDYDLVHATEQDADTGKTAYIWRMVAFQISPMQQHKCMPCTADFSIAGKWSEKRDTVIPELDRLANIVTSTIPLTQHYGTIRWGRALGYF